MVGVLEEKGKRASGKAAYRAKRLFHKGRAFIKWTLIAVAVGVLVGVIGSAFGQGIHYANLLRKEQPWIIWLLPLGGLVIAGLYRILGEDKGSNRVLSAVHTGETVSLKVLVGIFVSTIITHLLGGSAGREGAALQIGSSCSGFLGRRLGLSKTDCMIITMCGMSAGFAALFGTPVAAAIFAIEVASVGLLHYSAIVPSLVAGATASGIAHYIGAKEPVYDVLAPSFSFLDGGRAIVLGVVCALVSVLFCVTIHMAGKYLKHWIKNPYIRVAAGGVAILLMTLILGNQTYNGAGNDTIFAAVSGEKVVWYAFLLKILFTAITLGSGYKGGEIVPLLFVGSTLGSVVGGLLGLSPAFGAVLGMVGVFCGATNCPLAAIILGVELFGGEGMVYFALVCGVSYMLSGYYSLYGEQRILYSKFHPRFIDRRAGGNH